MNYIKTILLVSIASHLFGNKISDAYKALDMYDYFKAKHLFYKCQTKKQAEASFGLATIFYRTDNPFSNIDSAAKYIAISKIHFKDTATYFSYHINSTSINDLSDAIIKKGYEKYTSKNSMNDFNHFLSHFYFASDSVLKNVFYLRDNERLIHYSNYESSDSIQVFLLKYPESELYERAKKLYFTFQYAEQTKTNSQESFKKFIKIFPKNPNKPLAEQKLFELVKKLHQTDSLYAFIKKYSSPITQEEAWKLLYSTFVKTYDKESLTDFMHKYPDYPYNLELLKEIALSKKILMPIKNNDSKMGYIDTLGNWIIKPLYDDASAFKEGFASVCKNDSCFYINKEGLKTSEMYFDEAEDYKNGFAIVKKDKDYFLINRAGQLITKGYQDINEESDNLFVCKQGNMYGAINVKGEIVIPFIYNKLGNFKNGYAYYISDKYGLVDVGNYALKAQWDWVSDVDVNSLVLVKKNNKFGLMNLNEQLLLQTEYDFITACQNGIYLVVKNNLYGFYHASEKCFITDINYDYDKALENAYYTNGKQFKLIKDEEIALIDANGRFSINFGTYANLFFAKCDLIRIEKNNKYGFVDRKLKLVIPVEYDEAEDYENDFAITTKKNTTYLINKSGKSVYFVKDGSIEKLENSLYQIESNNLYGLIDKTGNSVLPIEYLNIEQITDYLFRCKKNDKLFLFNSHNKSVTELQPF